MTIDFYYTPGSTPCRAVELLAKLLNIKLNPKILNLMNKEQLKPDYIKINPQHTVPTIVDDGFALWESGAILIYLAEKFDKNNTFYPNDLKKRATINQRLFFNIATLGSRFGDYYFPVLFGNGKPDETKLEKLTEALKFLDTFLEGHEFVTGNTLTVADIALVSTIANVDVAKLDLSPYKNINKWYAKMKTAIPGYEEVNGKETLIKMFENFMKK